MKIHHYSEKSGEYLGTTEARRDPVEGKPLVPNQATTTEPPTPGNNEAVRWNAGAWEVVPDYRGVTGYDADGQKHTIEKINETPNPNWTEQPPEPEPVTITQFSSRQFLQRLTRAERLAIKNSGDDDALLWYDELIAADFVDVTDQDTINGAQYGLQMGIFADQARVDEILQKVTQ